MMGFFEDFFVTTNNIYQCTIYEKCII